MKKLLTVLCLALGIIAMTACGADEGENTILQRDAAIGAIQGYVQTEDYRTEQIGGIDALISEYMGKIGAATTQDEIDALVQEAKGKLDAVKTDAQLDAEEALASAKAAAKSSLASYKDKADYREAQKAQIDAILAEANAAIDGASAKEAIDAAVAAAKGKLDALKTDAQLSADELAAAKQAAKAEVATYKSRDAYRTAQQTQYDAILAEANAAIDEAEDTAGIDAAVAAAEEELDALPTDAQLTETEQQLEGLKTQKKSELAAYKDRADYRPDEQAQYDGILQRANAAIDGALTEEAITQAVEAAKEELGGLKTAAEYEAEELAALNAAKESAKNALDAHFEETDFTEEDWASIESAIQGYKTQIDEKTTIQEVQALLADAQSALDETWLSQRSFRITAMQAENGHITVSAERAKAGTAITFSCEAEEGFRAYNGSLSVKTAGGEDVAVARASFTMPSERVEISVSFVREPDRNVPMRLTSPDEEDIAAHKLGWESTTATGRDGWPAEANKQSVRIEGFGYINNLTIHGMAGNEVGFTYDLEKAGARYDYFSAEVGIHFDNTNNAFTTMHVLVRFQEKNSEEWGNEYKLLIYGMQSPTLIQVPIPENAAKMQLHADPGDPEKDMFPDGNNFDIIVWGNPMLYNGTLGENVNSLALATVQPTEATTGYDPIPAHNYGIKSYPGYNLMPTVAGKTYRDGFITNGSGVDGDDKGFTFDLTDYCGEGGLDTLVGYAGLQDDPNYSGEAKLVIEVDGVVKFEKVMQTGDEAVPVRIPVLGATELKLLVVNTDNNKACDACVYAEMTLIREAAHPIDGNTVLLSDLEYTGTTFWPAVEAKYYSVSDFTGKAAVQAGGLFYTGMTKVNGATVDGGFITHSDSTNADSWHGFTFDLKDEAFERLVGYFGVVDTADIGGAFTSKQPATKMSYKILADMGSGQFDSEIVSATVVEKGALASIDVSVAGAKRIQLLMSCGPDGATSEGDLGIFTGMYLTSAAKA